MGGNFYLKTGNVKVKKSKNVEKSYAFDALIFERRVHDGKPYVFNVPATYCQGLLESLKSLVAAGTYVSKNQIAQ